MKSLLFFVITIVYISTNFAYADDDAYDCYHSYGQQNFGNALNYCQKACSSDYEISCLILGHLYAGGLGVKQNYYQAKILYEKACNLENPESCTNLGNLYLTGKGVSKNYPQAKKFYGKACSLNEATGCANLAYLYQNGYGVNKNYQQANTYLEIACNLENPESCTNLGNAYLTESGVSKNYQQAKIFYEKACSLNEAVGCTNLAYLYQNGYGVNKNYQQANKYLEIACNLNYEEACYYKAKIANETNSDEFECFTNSDNNNLTKVKESCENSCIVDKNGASCNNLGTLYEKGIGLKSNYSKANFFYTKACYLKNKTGCYNLGRFFHYGIGVEQNYLNAQNYYKKACNLGDEDACSIELPKSVNSYESYYSSKLSTFSELPVFEIIFFIIVFTIMAVFFYKYCPNLKKLKVEDDDWKVEDDDWKFKTKNKQKEVNNNSNNEYTYNNGNSSDYNYTKNNTSSNSNGAKFTNQEDPIINLYTEIFALAGYVARGHGQITKEQIEIVSKSINSVGATEKEKKTYQNKFNEGKTTNFSPNSSCRYILNELKDSNTKDSVISFIFELLLPLAFVENCFSQNGLSRITTIARLLDIPNEIAYSMIQNFEEKHKNKNKNPNKNPNKNQNKNANQNKNEKQNEKPILNLYTEIFALAGYIARGQGKISKEQIKIVSQTIDSIAVTEHEKTCYQNKFNEGKQDNFNIEPSCSFIYSLFVNVSEEEKIAIIVYIFDLFMPIVYADGKLTDEELSRILAVARLINLPERLVHSFIYEYENKQRNYQKNERNNVEKAFNTLGLDTNATYDEVKKAYKRLIKKYHPDRVKILNIPENQKEKVMKDYTQKAQEINEAYSILKKHFEN